MGAIPGGLHGPYSTVVLENELVRLELVPGFGAKVISLLDRATGREWLTRGFPPADGNRAEAVFGGEAAYGWDECLPSVSPGADPLDPSRELRDHGDVWGRPAEARLDARSVETVSEGVAWPYRFGRTLTLDSRGVRLDYTLLSLTDRPLPFVWSIHPLLALEPGSTIHVPDATRMHLSHQAGLDLSGREVRWPRETTPGGRTVELDRVRGLEAGQVVKLYTCPVAHARAAVAAPDGTWLGIEWDGGFAPYLGLWLDFGGWPAAPGHPLHQVALEPTTAPADDLPSAIARGQALIVRPRARVSWWVRVVLGVPGGEGLDAFLNG